jgi:hypothetical protein
VPEQTCSSSEEDHRCPYGSRSVTTKPTCWAEGRKEGWKDMAREKNEKTYNEEMRREERKEVNKVIKRKTLKKFLLFMLRFSCEILTGKWVTHMLGLSVLKPRV